MGEERRERRRGEKLDRARDGYRDSFCMRLRLSVRPTWPLLLLLLLLLQRRGGGGAERATAKEGSDDDGASP